MVFGIDTLDGRDIRAPNVFAFKRAERTDNCSHRYWYTEVYYIGGRYISWHEH